MSKLISNVIILILILSVCFGLYPDRTKAEKERHIQMKTIIMELLAIKDEFGRPLNNTEAREDLVRILERIQRIEYEEASRQ